MEMTVNVQELPDQIMVKICGEIDAYTAPKLKETFLSFESKETVCVTVDLSEVSYMDSTGLGVFVGLFKMLKRHNGKLKLTRLSPRLKRLFEITGLMDIMEINR